MRLRIRPGLLIIAPALAFGAVAGILLLLDLKNADEIRGTHLIGKLVRLEGRVRYKRKGEYIWKDALKNQPLYRGDLIIAGTDAAAIVETESGQKIQLQAGSSVVLDDPEKLQGPAVNGSVLLHGADGEERFLASVKDGLPGAAPTSIRLIAPEELSDLFVDASKGASSAINFSWKAGPSPGSPPALLQIAPNHFFEEGTIQEMPIPSGSESLAASVVPGKHYWRIADAAKKPLSVYREFSARGVQPIKPELPSGPSIAWNGSLDFQWSSSTGEALELGAHWIEISSDEEFKELVQKKQIPALSIRTSVPELKEGMYHWRIVSHYPGLTIAGPAIAFGVQQGKQIQLTLVAPRDEAVLPSRFRPLLEWESNISRGAYHVEVQGPKNRAWGLETSRKSIQFEELVPGTYRWRVAGVLGELKSEAPWRKFTIVNPGSVSLRSPKPGETIEVAAVGVPVTFAWSGDAKRKGLEYVLEVAADPEFQRVIGYRRGRSTETTSSDFNLSPGQDYFWRVSSALPGGDGLAISTPSSFRFVIYKGLPAPGELLPQEGVACNPIKTKGACSFSWAAVPGAAQYEIEFYRAVPRTPASEDLTKPAFKKRLDETTYRGQDLEEGSYFWRVRAYDSAGRPGTAAVPRRFTIDLGKRLSAPRTRSSEVQ